MNGRWLLRRCVLIHGIGWIGFGAGVGVGLVGLFGLSWLVGRFLLDLRVLG